MLWADNPWFKLLNLILFETKIKYTEHEVYKDSFYVNAKFLFVLKVLNSDLYRWVFEVSRSHTIRHRHTHTHTHEV